MRLAHSPLLLFPLPLGEGFITGCGALVPCLPLEPTLTALHT
jgi:hypothetical protein